MSHSPAAATSGGGAAGLIHNAAGMGVEVAMAVGAGVNDGVASGVAGAQAASSVASRIKGMMFLFMVVLAARETRFLPPAGA